MIYVVDLDGTLCDTEGRDYEHAKPIQHRIDRVNRLFDAGHVILIDSARGSATGRDWLSITEAQLDRWGVKCHDVRTGVKYYGDKYVDDKAMTLGEFDDSEV
jgi:hypothetical protein